MVRIHISDPEAMGYPFPPHFQLGDIVEHVHGGRSTRGRLIDATYEGPSKARGGGNYRVTYTVEQANGLRYDAGELDLKKLNGF
jgi:hypothetical protein